MVIVTFHRSLKSTFMDLSVFVVFGSILAICMKYDPLWFYLENAYEAKSLSVSHSVHKTKVIKPGRPMIWKKSHLCLPPTLRAKGNGAKTKMAKICSAGQRSHHDGP